MVGGWPRWLAPPTHRDGSRTAAAATVWSVTWALLAGLAVLFPLALSDPRNPPYSVFALDLPLPLALVVVLALVRRGHERIAGWGLCLATWSTVSAVLFFAGGLEGHNAVAYSLVVVLAGLVLGLRASVAFASASIVAAGLTAWAAERDLLPDSISPGTPWNSFVALTVTLLITTLVLGVALGVLRSALDSAQRALEEKQAAQARLEEARKLEVVGRMAAGVAHDLNNLLAVVRGVSDVLRLDARGPSPLLGDLDDAVDRASVMTRRLLRLGHPGSDAPVRLDLHRAVEEAVPLLSRLVGPSHPIVVEGLSRGTVDVSVPPTTLDQVLLNLVINARDAMPDGGTIHIRASAPGALDVVDSGIGMDRETQARIFEPFFSTKPTGTGLGLATVRQLVHASDGEIVVESTPGKGSRFTVRFPVLAASERPRATSAA